jgi:formylglycine-generating enzyme required for sulfatase activity
VFAVSVSEYLSVMGSVPPPVAASDASLPITHVSFDDAQEFIARLSKAAGVAYRLPSEAEWEYACRAGSRSRYCWGDSIDATKAAFAWQATHSPSPLRGPMSPGSFASNMFGLYDMHGNVREWTADLWHESYEATPVDGSPAMEGHGAMRVVRGGSWSDGPSLLRSSARMRATHSSRVPTIGLRVARDLTLSAAKCAPSSDEQEAPHPEPDKTSNKTEKPVGPKAWYIEE